MLSLGTSPPPEPLTLNSMKHQKQDSFPVYFNEVMKFARDSSQLSDSNDDTLREPVTL